MFATAKYGSKSKLAAIFFPLLKQMEIGDKDD
jgi:hypothetical protein